MSAQEILDMIDNAEPSDKKTLDKIDALVWCFINKKTYQSHTPSDLEYGDCYGNKILVGVRVKEFTEYKVGVPYANCPPVTRSRDEIKKIRALGWWFIASDILLADGQCGYEQWEAVNLKLPWELRQKQKLQTPYCATECLAELHAIIQAIDYERTHP